jgi:tetratricopeptide (TPR) repeat protein
VRGVEQLVASALAAPKNGTAALSPLARRPETGPSDLLSAERHYQRGLTNFWAGRYWAAENDFYDAIRAANSIGADARYYYFLGLTQLAQGKLDEAREMFRMAGLLEKDRRPPSAVVSRALERVQGGLRRAVEEHRP